MPILHTWRSYWNVGIVALSVKNGVVAAFFQRFLSVLFGKVEYTVASVERLNRVLELFHHPLNEVFRIRASTLGLCQKIRLVPVSVITVLLQHIGGDNDLAFRGVASVVGTDKISFFDINIDLFGSGTDLQSSFEVFAWHGIMELVVGKGEIPTHLG